LSTLPFTKVFRPICTAVLCAAAAIAFAVISTTADAAPKPGPILLTHYMPWFTARPFSQAWGWHWTMNHYDPDHVGADGRADAASHYRPLIGLYDSGDSDVAKCQAMLMKLAGIDGIVVDWYGHDEFNDFGINNRNTLVVTQAIAAAGLHYAICYEDTTVPKEIAGGLVPASDAVGHGQRLMQWMQTNMFSSPAYLKIDGRPVLLVFGQPYYNDSQWRQIFSVLPQKPLFFNESDVREPSTAAGGFDWPLPAGGTKYALAQQDVFDSKIHTWPYAIAAAYPRFDDIYAQAGVQPSWGHVDDDSGQTYVDTLTKAIQSKPTIVQLVTWNDYGEGTEIEPTMEYHYRDLEATQKLKRGLIDPSFSYTTADLRFPVAWFETKKKYATDPAVGAKLDAIYSVALHGDLHRAESQLARYTH
jgi:hypothetical protein